MYIVQCFAGHVYQVQPGSNTEKRCQKREKDGFIDALIISPDECPGCLADREDQLRHDAGLCALLECPGNQADCAGGCLYLRELRQVEAKVPADGLILGPSVSMVEA